MKRLFKKIVFLFRFDLLLNKLMQLNYERQNTQLKKIFPNSMFYGKCIITNIKQFSIGEGSNIKNAYIESTGGIKIGRYVHCGINLTIFTTNHNYESDKSIPYDEVVVKKPVTVNDFVWLGANVSIVPGVTIGEGAVIGMGTVVTKSVPPLAIVGGNPSVIIKFRNKEKFEKLKNEGKFF